MRMRNKPWARPELNACPFFIQKPEECRGKWHSLFPKEQPVEMELGCGKGFFLAGAAPANPGVNYIGIDVKDAVLGPAKRLIERAFEELGGEPRNVLLTALNIERITDAFSPQDTVRRIYINFCNPWPKLRHQKRRLTYPRMLESYQTFLEPGGEIFFKTDDDSLFDDSVGYFRSCGFRVDAITRDLHGDGWPGNIVTEHEIMFLEKGVKIKALRAVWPGPGQA